ncbi:MAG: DUF2723 domain-containing protein [Prevotellaceae bacterium]|jgi:tetratricopeptide (TPR) repeat protein|nr:DUF2723 domain-containing protein [Prevotellaceae bacterium]
MMNNFKRINTIAGWLICAVASVVYLLTIEPTTSFWDCGEFIASAYKLEVGHPPGNPVFQLFGRFFSMFAPTAYVASMINAMSALCSGLTILFLFWTITHLARRVMERQGGSLTVGNTIAIIAAGAVGALAYTFSDTFWFSAVEAEVYAMSSLFTAVVFWAILKWEEQADSPYANRWIVLIAYLMGLSIGVHLLNLLAIPAIALVYYFKKHEKITSKGVILTLLTGGALVLAVLFFIPFLPTFASYFDLVFVNSFGLPFNSGVIFAVLLILAAAVYGIVVTYRKKKVLWNTIILSFIVVLIGYSTFAVVVIRSSANTPTNENQPDNPYALLYYLNREQYGSAPLISGETYASNIVDYAPKKSKYIKKGDKYVEIDVFAGYKYDPRHTMFFPRMWSAHQEQHKNVYKTYVNQKRRGIINPQTKERIPTFGENLQFFFSYQVNWMYFRYFMWNFAGRQNDIQGYGNSYHGNWESGIPVIDNIRLDDMSNMPPYLANNKSRNHYYMLPLLLGLIGLFHQLNKDKRNFTVVAILFFLTGIAIIMYLNQPPAQPRERDYAYAGSFYAFTIWIGLGVYALYDYLRKKIPAAAAASIAGAACLLVPLQMAAENWDDHDRSNRFSARDVAYNYLNSCEKDAILFTVGDNDTFPLWYIQEVEGVRTDVRVVNLSLLGTEWYIDQMKCRMYDSPPVPFKLPREAYLPSSNDYVPVQDQLKTPIPIGTAMEYLTNPRYRRRMQSGDMTSYIPSRNIVVPVNKQNILKSRSESLPEWAQPANPDELLDSITVTVKGDGIYKSDMMILDLLANNDWERPVYFSSMGVDARLDLRRYFQNLGFVSKLTPLKSQNAINTAESYDKIMNVYRWGNVNKKDVLVEHYNSLTLAQVLDARGMHMRLAKALTAEGKNDLAIAVLDSALTRLPAYNFPLNISVVQNEIAIMEIIGLYYQLAQTEKADTLAKEFIDLTSKNIAFFSRLTDGQYEAEMNMYYMDSFGKLIEPYNKELAEQARQQVNLQLRE